MTIFVFGDSFTGPFTLIKNNNLQIYKFKGASLHGLTKENNENRLKILETINKTTNIDCAIFNFGQVDRLLFYYKIFIKNEEYTIKHFKKSVKKYIKFIDNLKFSNKNKLVFAIYPTTLIDDNYKNVLKQLYIYNVITQKDIDVIDKDKFKKYSTYEVRFKVYKKYNKYLKYYCNKYDIPFLDFTHELLDKNNKLKKKFINPINKLSIHVLWEETLPIIIKNLKKNSNCDVGDNTCEIQETCKKYFISKKQKYVNRTINI